MTTNPLSVLKEAYGWTDKQLGYAIAYFMISEAKASIALDKGEDGVPIVHDPANAYVFRRLPNGKLTSTPIYDPTMPYRSHPNPKTGEVAVHERNCEPAVVHPSSDLPHIVRDGRDR